MNVGDIVNAKPARAEPFIGKIIIIAPGKTYREPFYVVQDSLGRSHHCWPNEVELVSQEES